MMKETRRYRKVKAKSGFILKNVVNEYILMPVGDNIENFNGVVLLNDVSAYVWEKLQEPVSFEELVNAVIEEFDVEPDTARNDLDELLIKLKSLDVIEE